MKTLRYHAQPTRGFALVATLSLMVLLAILAIGLLGLSSVALRSTSQGSAEAEARANARMALMLAIGQLQQELGSDQRISAPHGLAGGDPGGRPHWTATYDAWTADPASNAADTPGSRQVKFRKWLVSGTPGSGAEEILLVGPRTLGTSATPDDQVSVPLQSLNADSGRVGWWISDEGMKAKINAGPNEDPSPPQISTPVFQTQAALHPDQRAFPPLANFVWKDGERQLAVSPGQVNLAAGLGNASLGAGIHGLTVHSAGVLADVRLGRLRRDLSQLLSRPIGELEDKPLNLSDGRMNRFDINADGELSNKSLVGAADPARYTDGEWGINIEELSLFHNIHREIDWAGGVPALVTKDSVDNIALDRHQIYRRHVLEAMQFIFSLEAVQSNAPPAAPLYKMQLKLDGMVVLSNPNDVKLRFPPGLIRAVDLQSFAYDAKLKVTKANGSVVERTTIPPNGRLFIGYVEGGFGGTPAGGFELEPGEAAVFGSTAATGANLNLRRGFSPGGGITMTNWDLGAARVEFLNLAPNDTIDFEFVKNTTPRNAQISNTYFQAWHGVPNTPQSRIFESANLTSSASHTDPVLNSFLPPRIPSPQSLKVSDFIITAQNPKPKPIMLFSIIRNVERNSGGANPDALPSRPYLMSDTALGNVPLYPAEIQDDLHKTQMMFAAKPLNYQFETFAAGVGGRNIYQGGGRQPSVGGDFNVIKRRIPFAPPLSLGAFENAITCGFWPHYGDPAFSGAWGRVNPGVDPAKTGLNSSVAGASFSYPCLSKVIGNSFSHPFLAPDKVHRPRKGNGQGVRDRAATDPSWMVNTALWDPWFLSGIVDGSSTDPANPMKDLRTARAQFKDLAEGTGMLRNTRYRFHPHKSPQEALDELFTGNNFKGSALNSIGKYLLIDGAFNVNSTYPEAWAAMFRSVAGQEVILSGGATKAFGNPYGTLGYTTNDATSGTSGDWSGLRDLTDDQIKTLAEKTVDEVKARGPFLSMADFVNRRPNASDSGHQAVGALQAAIDKSGLNDRFTGAARGLTAADLAPLAGSANLGAEAAPARAVGAAGHLRQAGILTAMGSQISVRSDTFVVRAYGDSRDKSGNVQATAYCEAVIQRVPEFVDPTDAPEATPVSTVNKLFGRAFRMVSFRWLAPSEV